MQQVDINKRHAPALDTDAAAQYLGMRPCTLRTWRRRGHGPAFVKFDSGTVRYRLSELEKYASGDAPITQSGEG